MRTGFRLPFVGGPLSFARDLISIAWFALTNPRDEYTPRAKRCPACGQAVYQ